MINKKVFVIKFIHSLLFFLMVFCLFYSLYCAITRKYDWTLPAAMAIVLINGLAITINHGRCPLTTLAEKYGAVNGAVTHLFMPMFCARYVFKFFIVMFIVEVAWLSVGYFA
jgi:hypothetical protein